MTLDALLARLTHVRRSGHSYSTRCPAHGRGHKGYRNSFSVTLKDGRIWLCCHHGCSFDAILSALGVRSADLYTDEVAPVVADEDRIRRARSLWDVSQLIAGSVAERYLRRARGIDVQLPPAVRAIPLLQHREYGWPFPVLAAGFQDANGGFSGLSLTWLAADGTGKAPAQPERKVLGILKGSAIRLAPPAEVLALAEGIETGLSFQQATSIPTWTAGTATNLRHVVLPAIVREVVIAADVDATGREQARRAALTFHRQGRRVRITYPRGRGDFNDG